MRVRVRVQRRGVGNTVMLRQRRNTQDFYRRRRNAKRCDGDCSTCCYFNERRGCCNNPELEHERRTYNADGGD